MIEKSKRSNWRKVLTFACIGIAILCFIALFMLGGLISQKDFQRKSKEECKVVLEKFFTERGETIRQFIDPDYDALGGFIEIGVETDTQSYVVLMRLKNSFLVRDSVLNMFIEPQVEVGEISKRPGSP